MTTKRLGWTTLATALTALACSSGDDTGPTGGAAGAPIDATSDLSGDRTSDDVARDAPIEIIPCDPTASDIVGRIRCLPGVTIVMDHGLATTGPLAGNHRIDMTVDLPVDHTHPEGAHFQLQTTLQFRSETAPVVLSSSGYQIVRGTGTFSPMFGANTLNIEHRYFGASRPRPTDWRYLDIKQSADDAHVVTQTFKTIFKGKWVGTGASKGGTTSVYHRRFYPDDVDGTVAFVAPHMNSNADARFPPFLEKVGGDDYADCRRRLRDVQRAILARRDEIEPLMPGNFEIVGSKEIAFERAVVLLEFTFWQYTIADNVLIGCPAIPAPDAPADALYGFFDDNGFPSLDEDSVLKGLFPYYYQVASQLGAPAKDRTHLQDLLRHEDAHRNPWFFLKGDPPLPEWDGGRAMADIQAWVKSDAAKTIMFIYGEFDPWSAAPFEINPSGDNHLYIAPRTSHGADLRFLTDGDRAEAMSALERWMGVPPKLRADEVPAEAPPHVRWPL